MKRMIRTGLVLVVLGLPLAWAQQLYVGAAVGNLNASQLSLDDVGAHIGLNFVPSLGVRASLRGDLVARQLETGSLDALVNLGLFGSAATLYLGAGAALQDIAQLSAPTDLQQGRYTAHAVGGAEIRLGPLGLFGELQPSLVLSEDYTTAEAYYLTTRAGLNIHF